MCDNFSIHRAKKALQKIETACHASDYVSMNKDFYAYQQAVLAVGQGLKAQANNETILELSTLLNRHEQLLLQLLADYKKFNR